MKTNLKLFASLTVLFLSTQVMANQATVGQQPLERPCCEECVDAARGGEVVPQTPPPVHTPTSTPVAPAG